MVVIARLWLNIDRKRSDFFEFFYLSILFIWPSGCDAKSSGIGLQVALVIRRSSPPSPTSRFSARLFHQPALLQDHSYQLVLVDLSLAFGFQPAHSFVMLPEADRWQREVAVGNRPVVTLLILPIDSRKITGIVLDKLTSLRTTSPRAEYVVPIVQVKQPNPIASNLPTFHRQKVQEKAFPILRLTRRSRPLSKATLPGGGRRLVQRRMLLHLRTYAAKVRRFFASARDRID